MSKLTKAVPVALMIMFCLSVSLISSSVMNGTHPLSAGAESVVLGGASDCHDFMEGFAVGMGIGAIFGCVWCAGVAIGAKVVGLFC